MKVLDAERDVSTRMHDREVRADQTNARAAPEVTTAVSEDPAAIPVETPAADERFVIEVEAERIKRTALAFRLPIVGGLLAVALFLVFFGPSKTSLPPPQETTVEWIQNENDSSAVSTRPSLNAEPLKSVANAHESNRTGPASLPPARGGGKLLEKAAAPASASAASDVQTKVPAKPAHVLAQTPPPNSDGLQQTASSAQTDPATGADAVGPKVPLMTNLSQMIAQAQNSYTSQGSVDGVDSGDDYKGQIYGKLEYPPPACTTPLQHGGAVYLAISIDGKGALTSVSVIHSSGLADVDAAAQRLVRCVAPFPPPPDKKSRSIPMQLDF